MESINPLVRLLSEAKKHRIAFMSLIILSLSAGPLKGGVSLLWGQVIDVGVAGDHARATIDAGLMVLLVFVTSLCTIFQYKAVGIVGEKSFRNLRLRFLSSLLGAETMLLQQKVNVGDMAMRLSDDMDRLSDMMSGQFSNFLRLFSQGMAALVFCFVISIQMSVIYLVLLPVGLWLMKKVSGPIAVRQKAVQNSIAEAMNKGAEAISSIEVVKAFTMEEKTKALFSEDLKVSLAHFVKMEKTTVQMTVYRYALNVLLLLSLFGMGMWLVREQVLTIGDLLAFLALSQYIKEVFENLDYFFWVYRQSTSIAQRVYEMVDLEQEQSGDEDCLRFDVPVVQMKKVSVVYKNEAGIEIPALREIDMSLEQKQKIALIGPSGCGKSTILKLLCRFIAPQSGELSLFGVDAKRINIDALRKEVALVSQESFLFEGSLFENIACVKPSATILEVEEAIKNAYLWKFISDLPEGYHTNVGEFGSRLSGGQRQRVSIARALLSNAKLVLLDEATSALDDISEREVQWAIDRLLEKRAAVIVAHRMSAIEHVDYVYQMEKGEVVASGPPDEFLKREEAATSDALIFNSPMQGGAC